MNSRKKCQNSKICFKNSNPEIYFKKEILKIFFSLKTFSLFYTDIFNILNGLIRCMMDGIDMI